MEKNGKKCTLNVKKKQQNKFIFVLYKKNKIKETTTWSNGVNCKQ